jgi:hypothetical protein
MNRKQADRPNEIDSYVIFQRAVADGFAEAERLDALEPVFIPYGRCHRHPGVVISNGMFDGLCHICEGEMNEDR